MNRTEINQLLSVYDIGEIIYTGEIELGNSSFALRVDSEKGSYVLRQLSSIRSAFDEYAIADALWGCGISPMVLKTVDEVPYTAGDHVYNLQERINGNPIAKITPALAFEMGKTAVRMRDYLIEAGVNLKGRDRFSLHEKLHRESFEKLAVYKRIWELFGELDELSDLDYAHSVAVHGDLGIWNLLEEEGKIHIVDYGEAHMGSEYFDLAALLFSIIEYVSESEEKEIFDSYLKGCERGMRAIDIHEMRKTMHLWAFRGFLSALDYPSPDPWVKQLLTTYKRTDDLFALKDR